MITPIVVVVHELGDRDLQIPWNISHTCEVYCALDNLDERVTCHVCLELPGEDEA